MDDEWLDFMEDAAQRSKFHKGPRCTLGLVLDGLPEHLAATVRAALARPDITHRAIVEALRKRLGDDAPGYHCISRHRRGDCACKGGPP